MMYEDNIDCLGVLNTSSIDPETGEPEMLYKRVTFAVDDTQNLLWTCEYGNSPGELTAQYSNQNIIGGVESFQVLYGVDTDFPPDFSVNSWTNATNIDPESTVCLQGPIPLRGCKSAQQHATRRTGRSQGGRITRQSRQRDHQ